MKINLDNASTTKVDPEVVKTMKPYFTKHFGNASSIHFLGLEAKKALEESRKIIAEIINADPKEIIFTSGGTESNNLALKGMVFSNPNKHIITTKIEHPCIMESCKWLEKQGTRITYLDVDPEGFVNLEQLEKEITQDTILVSIIHGNNEIGTIQNLEKIGEICQKHNTPLHTDACQSFTKIELDVKKQNLSLVTLNAHKIHGPKGIGALYVKKGIRLTPLLHGGGHENKLRSGTENIPAIVGFAKAVQLGMDKKHNQHMSKLRDELIKELLKIPDSKLNGPKGNKRLSNNVNISFKYIEGESIGGLLNAEYITSSTGSACSSKSLEPSHVLLAIGLDHEDAHGSLRLTLSRFNTQKEIDSVIKEIPPIIKKLRKMSPLRR